MAPAESSLSVATPMIAKEFADPFILLAELTRAVEFVAVPIDGRLDPPDILVEAELSSGLIRT